MERLTKCVGFRGDIPIYTKNSSELRGRPSADLVSKLVDRLGVYEDAEKDGRLVMLPETLTAPYDLNERYWVCGWDSDNCTLTIQDRKLLARKEDDDEQSSED